jgi:hypothetical protein
VSDQLFADIFSRLCDALAAPRVDVRTTAAIGLQLLVRDASGRVPCTKLVPLLITKLDEAIARSKHDFVLRVMPARKPTPMLYLLPMPQSLHFK